MGAGARYRAAADDVARWLTNVAIVEDDDTLRWPVAAEWPEHVQNDLGWGGLGPLLFFTDLYRASGDPEHIELAKRGAAHLRTVDVSTLRHFSPCGLFTGVAGFAVIFDALEDASGVASAMDVLRAEAIETADGINWAETTEVLWGTAGIGFVLLSLADKVPDAVELAARAGDWLVAQAEPRDVGVCFGLGAGPYRQRPEIARVRSPNFAHGTAGIASFLTKLSVATDEPLYLDTALDAARWVFTTCKTDDDGCIAHHHDPADLDYTMQVGPDRADGSTLYTLGWCHGPAGLGWFFRELALATGDPDWDDWIARTARTVRNSGIPAQREPGFWDNFGRCCGAATVVESFLDLHTWRNDPDDLGFALTVADDMLGRATLDDDGMRWCNIEFRAEVPEQAARTSFLQGASGIGMTLLRLARHLDGDRTLFRLPHEACWTNDKGL